MTRLALILSLAFPLAIGCEDEPEPAADESAETPAAAETAEATEEPAAEEPAGPTWDGPPLACARAVVVAWAGAPHAADTVTRTKEEAEARASELLARVNDGASIAEVARAESDAASSGPRGGLLGTYTAEGWPGAHGVLTDPVFELEVGERTGVIEAPYGYVFAERCEVELVHSRHVLVRYAGAKNAPDDVERSEAEARALAESIREEIEGGADFADVAREKSEDGSAERGGDVGVVGRGVLAPEYEAAVFDVAPGELTPVVQTAYGFHVIERIE